MLERFLHFVRQEKLVNEKDRVLLAVSGGVDSVVMCELFHKAGFEFGIAHCNFRLRGEESEEDERFVKRLAEHYDVPFYVKHFDTERVAGAEGISVQMAARELRYEWFEIMRQEAGYSSVATAHHRSDEVETFFINLVRGTGLTGLRGILPRNKNIIRPLLFSLREEIEEFAAQHKLSWREDTSNLSTKYLRNRIRHTIIPAFKEINSNIENVLSADIRKVRNDLALIEKHIEEKKKEVMREENGNVLLSIPALEKLQPLPTYLFHFLGDYNFREPVINEIIAALHAEPGKRFYSSTHRLIKDRMQLIVSPLGQDEGEIYTVEEGQDKIEKPLHMQFETVSREKIGSLKSPGTVAYIDKSRISFPLRLRRWKAGDHFYPLGMRTKKKLSDFFIDNKFSIADKERAWVLVSGEDIIWIVGHRLDDRFRVTEETSTVFIARLSE